ncbi:hypothetical protein MTQ01_16030 [Streptomyces sp. XM4193]|uniref:hypothetical protein n=1 Tax=Streptomyces sp. XM4193 TaxID=2929782 RepID=UPI001FFBA35F|nr:hypothetical protein [Streptomyces sp. XM4193]MCK1797506.1 hypothetical protein [Streptomyces sp. XM4193]
MIVALIVICEVAFWVLLAAGLALRYLARMPRLGAAVLLCEPLLELLLLAVTAVDLRNGATPGFKHGLAAVYIGFTVTHAHYFIRWADGHFAHRFAGAPRPAKPPRYGMARALHEWKMAARAILGAGIAAVLLQAAILYVGDDGQSTTLRDWQAKMGLVSVICVIWAGSYTLWPKRGPEAVPPAHHHDGEAARHQGRESAHRDRDTDPARDRAAEPYSGPGGR